MQENARFGNTVFYAIQGRAYKKAGKNSGFGVVLREGTWSKKKPW
jgi:hypothetical protein